MELDYIEVVSARMKLVVSDSSVPGAIPSSKLPQRPIFTIAVSAVDVLLLIITYIVNRGFKLSSSTLIKMGGKYVPCMKPPRSRLFDQSLKLQCHSFLYPYQFYRFFMPIFLHGGWGHLMNNLIFQLLTGIILERKYGTKAFAIGYILFGLSGNILSALFLPKSVSVGASGAVYGLILFCLIDNILCIFTIRDYRDKIIQTLVMFVVIPYFVTSFFTDIDFSGRIDHAGHVGGALMGILAAGYMCEIPTFITSKMNEKRIELISLISIIIYLVLTLLIFFLIKSPNLG
ncbi:unnamed protein product [Didymodactylos carnosus]|uniref:rhomboid protease n=1 Tax=Didymodactylos carnosus TaxID=1234261 RepID=A0A814HB79_9BILA|nr:unnamed protein product [Didymodactylos carnosus]CAF3778387.1 unnamed protein product [Didymodactylos carnosus]